MSFMEAMIPMDLIPEAVLEETCQRLKVLTHPQRLRLCELMLAGEAPVGKLAEQMDLRPNVVSQHLNQLRARGIVAPRREGRTVFYRVCHPSAGWLLTCIRRNIPRITAQPQLVAD